MQSEVFDDTHSTDEEELELEKLVFGGDTSDVDEPSPKAKKQKMERSSVAPEIKRPGKLKKKLQNKLRKQQSVEAIYETLQTQILGDTHAPDDKELELKKLVFGGDISEFIEETEEPPPKQICEEEKRKPAWVDEDDDTILVKHKAEMLTKCHRSITARGEQKYSKYAEEKFKSVMGAPKWADFEYKKKDSDDESEDELLQKTGDYIQESKSLSKGQIDIRRCTYLDDDNLRMTVIKGVEFHPSSRVAVVAGKNGIASLFQVDGEINAKIQSVHFETFPISTAHFTIGGDEIVVSSKYYGHFFTYDMIAGKIIRIPQVKGMDYSNIRRFTLSPDGKYIVIHGRYGNIHLLTVSSREWVGTLKMNGEATSVTFNSDGSKMFTFGETGEVYVWDMSTRACVHKFIDKGCVTGTSLAVSPNQNYLAAGSASGIVNIYDLKSAFSSSSPEPMKVLKNLITDVTTLKFNCTSELLAMASAEKENAVKLVHFPSATTFSNFPNQQTKIKYPNSLDISLNSGYLLIGNNVGSARLYRLKHYVEY